MVGVFERVHEQQENNRFLLCAAEQCIDDHGTDLVINWQPYSLGELNVCYTQGADGTAPPVPFSGGVFLGVIAVSIIGDDHSEDASTVTY